MTQIPPQFWSGPVVAAALAECDLPTVLEKVRRAHGWTQGQLAEAVGYSQSWVSKVLRGRQPLTVDQVREISIQIGVPLHCSDSEPEGMTIRRSAETSARPWR
ncbi:helix-turn-helix domain-containing protein [Nonomuraea sp. SBT364]|uniref:helix-turn-helix domain-containing protein n=1 Tax=Nonomuraea sp. SBT364 TaxID=1580530 RepID=UPI002F40F276